MRHLFATQLVERTGDVVAVSRLLGHRQLQNTLTYASSSPDRLAWVVEAQAKGGLATPPSCGTN